MSMKRKRQPPTLTPLDRDEAEREYMEHGDPPCVTNDREFLFVGLREYLEDLEIPEEHDTDDRTRKKFIIERIKHLAGWGGPVAESHPLARRVTGAEYYLAKLFSEGEITSQQFWTLRGFLEIIVFWAGVDGMLLGMNARNPGGGRPESVNKKRIEELHGKGYNAKAIANRLGCGTSVVYETIAAIKKRDSGN